MDINMSEAVTENVVERTFTAEENKNQMLANENDFIQGLLEAVDYRENETQRIEIVRAGRRFFSFEIRPLGESEYNQCRKRYTRYVKNKNLGLRLPEDTDNVKYRCSLIYNATVEKDREALWDNKKIWKALDAKGVPIVNALDVIEACLLGGEKDLIIDAIDKLSGFENSNFEVVEREREDTVKN